jgi:hypothetical protein
MPVIVTNKNFSDIFGNSQSFYKSNAGDQAYFNFDVQTSIRLSSIGNPILFDIPAGEITSASVSFKDEGFRVGDTLTITKYDSGGSVLITWNATLQYFVTDNIIGLSSIQTSGYDVGAGEIMEFVVTGRNRDDLDILINHVQNGQVGSSASLIDGEASRITLVGVDSLAVSGTIFGTLIPNQSGQYLNQASITRNADINSYTKSYSIELIFATSGMYDSTLYDLGNCLKAYVRLEWASISGEPFSRNITVINDDADTGWFNQAHNTEVADGTLVSSDLNVLEYCNPTTFNVTVDCPIAEVGIGGVYISQDDSYYKNKTERQSNLSMLLSTKDVNNNVGTPKQSGQNPDGADYQITINSVSVLGSETTFEAIFTPNGAFDTFMAGRDEGDRLFYLWVKAGNSNILLFQDQLTCPPAVAGPLNYDNESRYLDHNENIECIDDLLRLDFNIEDDIAFCGDFLVDFNEEIEAYNVEVQAYNSVTEQQFTLESVTFNFAGIQISGAGKYLLNESQTIITSLPTTSVKRVSTLELLPSIDTPTQYGIRAYYPFLLRWEYWLEQLNANSDFYPDQNKNWFPYDNTGDWSVRLQTQLIKNGLAFIHNEDINILNYDSEPNINSDIALYRESDNLLVTSVIEGELHRIVATHELISGTWGSLSDIWGMITIEPKESAPRQILSTVVPYDNDGNNPLKPITALFATLTLPSPNVAQIECLFDANLINLDNGVKITSKIKNLCVPLTVVKTLTDGTNKTTTGGDDKTIAN